MAAAARSSAARASTVVPTGRLSARTAKASVRPSASTGFRYSKVSNEFWNAVYAVLAKQKPADKALADLDAALVGILR